MPRPALTFAFVLLAACTTAGPTATVTAGPVRPTRTPPPTATPSFTPTAAPSAVGGRIPPLPTDRGLYFAASGACAVCHENLTDDGGADVSIGAEWRGTLMANSARDPYWLATLRAEVETHPDQRAAIEELCGRCHMPMAHFTAEARQSSTAILDGGFADPGHELHTLAEDGVSCSVCHQIREDGLGLPPSYNGGYVIDHELPEGERLAFGPYSVEDDQAGIMTAGSGYVPVTSQHIASSEMCATCHTLYMPRLDASGAAAGEFPEQVPYLEWFYSDYRRTASCASCHMPEAQGGVDIASSSTNPRSPFARHIFAGANPYILSLLQTNGDELGVTAGTEHFQESIDASLNLLKSETADVSLEDLALKGARLSGQVVVENLAGHKFPTSYPSRRAWLHITVRDADGQLVFESGAPQPDGSIEGNDNDADPAQFEPHYQAIVAANQVQIYETILRDSEGAVTTSVVRAVGYLKDNRLLADGFQKSAPYEDIAVRGEARDDPDFLGGGDRVQLDVPLSGTRRVPYTVTVELLFQPVGYRWMENLRQAQGSEVENFLRDAAAVPNEPVVIARAEGKVGE
jgi:mono/diheme cytochrome c family protein